MQVPIGFRRKARNNLADMASIEISIDYLLNKINGFLCISHRYKSGLRSKGEIIAAATVAINKKPA
jgi:hypothetical protein